MPLRPHLQYIRHIAIALLLALAGLFLPAQAAPSPIVDLAGDVCTLSGHPELTPEEVLSRSAEFRCGEDAFSEGTHHVWLIADVSAAAGSMKEPVLRMRPGNHGAITVHVLRKDGSARTDTYSEADIVRHWRVPDTISFPLTVAGSATPQKLVVGIVEPWDLRTLFDFQVLEGALDVRMHWMAFVAAAFVCGLLIAPFLMSILFYTTVRQTFILYYAALIAVILAYAVNWSGIIFYFFPDMDIRLRSALGYINVCAILLFMAMIVRGICEPEKLGSVWRTALSTTSLSVLLAGTLIVTLAPRFPNAAPELFYLLFILPVATICAALISASLKGSRYAQVQLVGWMPTFMVIAARLAQGTGLVPELHIFDIGFYPSLMVETLVTSGVIIVRSRAIWREHKTVLEERAMLRDLAFTDPLTGLLNRRTFKERFPQAMVASAQNGRSLAFALIDVDYFKSVNDTYGHAAGDKVLVELASMLDNTFGVHGSAARFGGEEFCLLADGSTPQAAEARVEALRKHIEQRVFPQVGRVTVSIGLVQIEPKLPVPFMTYYKAADAALYAAKAAGRNQLRTASWRQEGTGPRPADTEDSQAWELKRAGA